MTTGKALCKNVIASCALALGTVFCAWAQPQPLDLNGSWEFAFAAFSSPAARTADASLPSERHPKSNPVHKA